MFTPFYNNFVFTKTIFYFIFSSVSPYSQISLKVFNHNSLKKDVLVGEANLDIFNILRKNNGTVNKLKFPVTLKLPPNNHKSILSNRGPSYLFINLDGLAVDMSEFPEKETTSQGDRQSDTTAASTITPSTSSLNFDSQPSTSTEYENNNAVAEIISSLPKWSINDPNVGTAPVANGPPLENAPPPVNAPSPANSLPPANALPPVVLPGSGLGSSVNEHSSTSPSTRPPSINAASSSPPKPSTSGTTPLMTNGQPPNRPIAPPVEETLPSGWEIRFDTYGRYVLSSFLVCLIYIILFILLGNTMLITIPSLQHGSDLYLSQRTGRCEKTIKDASTTLTIILGKNN